MLGELASDARRGLAASEASSRRRRFGPNVLQRQAGSSALSLLLRQLNSPIVFLLIGSGVIAIGLGKVPDGLVVLAAVVLNGVLGFVQKSRAGKALEALGRMVPEEALVLRDGRAQRVPSTELVPGDVVQLASGDRVPADVRLLSTRNLQIDEAALTGESVPVGKSEAATAEDVVLGERFSMAFGGTLVTSGAARGVVVATGSHTELGRISELLESTVELQTPLTRALASVGKGLTAAVLAVSLLLLAVSLWRRRDMKAKPQEVGGWAVEPQTQVYQWAAHMNPAYFERPEEFLPSRWTPELEAALPRAAYTPFGGGPRICIGNHFAWAELVVVLAATLARYQLQPLAPFRPRLLASITARPRDPVPTRVVRIGGAQHAPAGKADAA